MKTVNTDANQTDLNPSNTKVRVLTVAPAESTSQDDSVDLNFENSSVSEAFKRHIESRINKEVSGQFARHDLALLTLLN